MTWCKKAFTEHHRRKCMRKILNWRCAQTIFTERKSRGTDNQCLRWLKICIIQLICSLIWRSSQLLLWQAPVAKTPGPKEGEQPLGPHMTSWFEVFSWTTLSFTLIWKDWTSRVHFYKADNWPKAQLFSKDFSWWFWHWVWSLSKNQSGRSREESNAFGAPDFHGQRTVNLSQNVGCAPGFRCMCPGFCSRWASTESNVAQRQVFNQWVWHWAQWPHSKTEGVDIAWKESMSCVQMSVFLFDAVHCCHPVPYTILQKDTCLWSEAPGRGRKVMRPRCYK